MKVVDIADEIFRELAEPTDISIPSVAFWVRTNIGALNNYLNQDFSITESTLEIDRVNESEATVQIGDMEVSILKKMYSVYYYNKKAMSTLGAASDDAVIELESDGSRITKRNKNEQSKTYVSLKKQEYEELIYLVNAYKGAQAIPNQVAGTDTIEGLYSPSYRWNRSNKSSS